MPAAVAQAIHLANEDLAQPEVMPVRAVGRWQREPIASAPDEISYARHVLAPLRPGADHSLVRRRKVVPPRVEWTGLRLELRVDKA